MDLKHDVEEIRFRNVPPPRLGDWQGMMQRTAADARSAGHSEHKTSNSTKEGQPRI
jgi:hypothetical protein